MDWTGVIATVLWRIRQQFSLSVVNMIDNETGVVTRVGNKRGGGGGTIVILQSCNLTVIGKMKCQFLRESWVNPMLLVVGCAHGRAEWIPGSATFAALLLGSLIWGLAGWFGPATAMADVKSGFVSKFIMGSVGSKSQMW